MHLQYISDSFGKKTAVIIPIEEWDAMKNKYKEVDSEEANSISIPEWQIELGRKELQHIANGTAELMDWEETKKYLNL